MHPYVAYLILSNAVNVHRRPDEPAIDWGGGVSALFRRLFCGYRIR
jgi:hypothetical protein